MNEDKLGSPYTKLDQFLDESRTVADYTGQGRRGDQKWERGNKTLLEAYEAGKPIHLFHRFSSADNYRYMGAATLAPSRPWRWGRDVDVDGIERDVIVFTLHLTASMHDQPEVAAGRSVSKRFKTRRPRSSHTREISASQSGYAEQREHDLEDEFCAWLESENHQVEVVDGPWLERQDPDIIDRTDGLVIEAKGSAERRKVREAIGQVLDYVDTLRRHGEHFRPAVLFPNRPDAHRVALIHSLGIVLIYRDRFGQFRYEYPDLEVAS